MNTKRLLAISDIHGNLEKFEDLIDGIELSKEDRLVILGDNVDRGPQNVQTVFRIMELKEQGYDIVTLMGNHEDMLIHYIEKYDTVDELMYGMDGRTAAHNGTLDTFKEYMELSENDKKRFLNEIKSYEYYYKQWDYLFVHAGVMSGTPLEHQNIDDLMWIREGFTDRLSHGLPYVVIFGHTPTKYLNQDSKFKIWRGADKIGIDCGASFGGKLACLDVFDDIEYYV